MKKEPVKVFYIGKKNLKEDTVCGTGTLWDGYGDWQMVDGDAAVRMIRKHPDVWCNESRFKEIESAKAEEDEDPEMDDTDGEIPSKPSDRISTVCDAIAILMDDGDDDAFSDKDGSPKVGHVRDIANDPSISTGEIRQAWNYMKARG